MLLWFLWTVVAGLLLSGAHVVATCLPAGWLTPNQGLQTPSDLVIHAQQLQQDLWPQCQSMLDSVAQVAAMPHADQQNLAMCQELDSILTDLQSSWHALHHHSQACSVFGVTPGLPSCSSSETPQSMPASSRPPNTNLPSIPKSPQRQQQQQQQQQKTQHQCLQPGAVVGDGISSSNRSPAAEGPHVPKAVHTKTQTAQAQHSQHALFPGPVFTPSIEQQQQHQQQQQTGHDWSVHQQPVGLLQQQAGQPNERLVLSQESPQGTAHGHQLWGGVLLSAQQLWDNLIYDTQVVQKQLESEAQIGGQACRSCLVPHLHKSHREVVSEVVALLVLGALCASGLFVVATFYRRRQSTRRQTQQSIATQRLRHFEKLQQQRRQEEEVRQSVEESTGGVGLPWLQRPQPAPAVAVKHTRHRAKASEPTIPSSPSASSSHSEAIGTQVRPHSNSKPGKAGEPKRARSAQRSAVSLGPVDSLHHGLGRSRSDLSTEAAQRGPFDMTQQSMHSMQGTEASMQDLPGSPPSTPSSMAGSTTFNPFHRPPSTHQAPSPSCDSSKGTSAASMDGSVDSVHAKQAGSKRRNRHKGKSRAAAKKPPPAKRRFIPGLDSEFDPAIHELPTLPQDPATDTVRQKGAEQSLGCSGPSPCSSALPELQARQQLSVDAPIFVPTGYANMGSFCRSPSHLPSTQLPDWQPQSGTYHYEGQGSPVPFQLSPETGTGSMLPEPALAPHLTQAPNLPFNGHLEMVSPLGRPWDYDDHGVYTLRPSVPKPSPRNSPTSVLPPCLPLPSEVGNPVFGTSISGSGCAPSPFSTAGEHQPQLGVVGSSRGWGLPPLLEESMGSPFPGMPSRTSERPNHATAGVSSVAGSIFSAPASSGTTVPEQPQLSSLPGFNSIWRTAKSTDMHSAEDTWQSFAADKSNSVW